MLIWHRKQQKKAVEYTEKAEIPEVIVEEPAEAVEEITVTDEIAELPEANMTSTVVRKPKKAKA